VPVAGSAYTFSYAWGTVLIVLVLGVLLAVGTKLSSRFSQIITAVKVAVVLLVIVVGIGYIKTANYTPFIPLAKPLPSGSLDQGCHARCRHDRRRIRAASACWW
jgi:basic amino acid/polyamine antiporter, APA family